MQDVFSGARGRISQGSLVNAVGKWKTADTGSSRGIGNGNREAAHDESAMSITAQSRQFLSANSFSLCHGLCGRVDSLLHVGLSRLGR